MRLSRILAIVGALVFVWSNVQAAIVTVPPSLSPGDQYRLVFITLGQIQALSSDISTYNDFVTAQANMSAELAALGTTWKIIGSTQTVDAKTNTSTDDGGVGPDGVPIFRLDGVIIANNYDDLWDGTIQNPLYVAQDGTVLNTCCGSWTGTLTTGQNAGIYALGASSNVVDGAPNVTGDFWVQSNPYSASSFQYVYAISGVLTVPELDTIPPVLNLPANITVDATSPAGATVNYTDTVTATDNSGAQPTISCIPLSGVTFAIGTTTVSCTATDGSGNSSTGSFTVTVNGAVEQLQNLISSIGIYTNPWTTSLDAKLQNAMDALTAMRGGNASSACNLLSAFIKEVQAQSGQQLTVAMATQLIASANQIRAVLGCS